MNKFFHCSNLTKIVLEPKLANTYLKADNFHILEDMPLLESLLIGEAADKERNNRLKVKCLERKKVRVALTTYRREPKVCRRTVSSIMLRLMVDP